MPRRLNYINGPPFCSRVLLTPRSSGIGQSVRQITGPQPIRTELAGKRPAIALQPTAVQFLSQVSTDDARGFSPVGEAGTRRGVGIGLRPGVDAGAACGLAVVILIAIACASTGVDDVVVCACDRRRRGAEGDDGGRREGRR